MILPSFYKILLPALAIAIVALLARYKYHYSAVNDLQLRPSPLVPFLSWLFIAICWILTTDWLLSWRGPWDFSAWKTQPVSVSIFRILGVCFLGPIAEELIFHGFLMTRLRKLEKISVWIVVILSAAGWALLHYSYTPAVVFIIFVQGIFLGSATIHTRSLYTPIAMHIAWNLYAIW